MEPRSPHPARSSTPAPSRRPRLAASVIVLRGGDRALEVLLVQRNPASRFMGGAWVFPGGAVDAADGRGRGGAARGGRARGRRGGRHRARAIRARSCRSRAGSRPKVVKIRFDTWFFLSPCPTDATPRDRRRRVRRLALEHAARGARRLRGRGAAARLPDDQAPRAAGGFPHADALVAHARGRRVEPVEPRVVLEGEVARVLLPGDPGYAAPASGGVSVATTSARPRARARARAAKRRARQRAARRERGAGITVAVTGPTGDIGRAFMRALERSREVSAIRAMARRRDRPRRRGLAEDDVPARRRARPRRRRRARRRRRRGRPPRLRDHGRGRRRGPPREPRGLAQRLRRDGRGGRAAARLHLVGRRVRLPPGQPAAADRGRLRRAAPARTPTRPSKAAVESCSAT